ncbi:MAG: aldo/keto reductase [Verrucomicrobiaceae bacterium]|nr:aldo/keto reductase [Verrucomicrobiaceae bacterium]
MHRTFGSTDIKVSPLGLGTVKFGRNQGVKYPQAFALPDDDAAAHLIALAKSFGINLIDTAPAYGSSEERIGHLLHGQRTEWVICTKVGEEFDNGVSHFDFSAAHTRYSIERSLRRMRTDYLDIVLVHSDGNDADIIERGEVLDELTRCKQQGLLRSFGISTKTVVGGIAAATKTDAVMATYNPDFTAEREVLDYCAAHRKGALIKKAFASGHSADPVAALQFALSHPGVSSAIVGTINPDHLRANVEAALALDLK